MNAELALFWTFAASALGAALYIAGFARDWVRGAIAFVLLAISLSGLDLLLGATFVGVARLIVHAGSAIAVLFAVVLLDEAGLDAPAPATSTRVGLRTAAAVVLVGCALALAAAIGAAPDRPAPALADAIQATTPAATPPARSLGLSLLTDQVLSVEALGLLLMTAGLIVVVFARRRSAP